MANRDPATNLDPDRDEVFSSILNRLEDQVMRFSTPPPADNAYDGETANDFLGQVPHYNKFRRQMQLLLQNPDYAYLRLFWNFLYIGEPNQVANGRDLQKMHPTRKIAVESQMEPQTTLTALHDNQAAHPWIRSYRGILVYGRATSPKDDDAINTPPLVSQESQDDILSQDENAINTPLLVSQESQDHVQSQDENAISTPLPVRQESQNHIQSQEEPTTLSEFNDEMEMLLGDLKQ